MGINGSNFIPENGFNRNWKSILYLQNVFDSPGNTKHFVRFFFNSIVSWEKLSSLKSKEKKISPSFP